MFRNLSYNGLAISGRQSELIELALSFQFKGMEFNLPDAVQQVEAFDIAHARRLIDSAGIQLGYFKLPIQWEDEASFPADLEKLAKWSSVASELGCKRCITSIGPAGDSRPYHENYEFHRKQLGEIGDVLAEHDIRFGIELLAPARLRDGRAFEFIHTFDALFQLVKMIGRDNVGLALDAWHLHVAGTTMEELQQLTAADIVAVFLSDAPSDLNLENADESDRLMPGETGAIDSAALLTTLAEFGFGGPVSVRSSRTGLDGMRRDNIVRLAGERLTQAWNEAGLTPAGTLSMTANR